MLLKQIVLSQPFGSAFDFVSLQSPNIVALTITRGMCAAQSLLARCVITALELTLRCILVCPVELRATLPLRRWGLIPSDMRMEPQTLPHQTQSCVPQLAAGRLRVLDDEHRAGASPRATLADLCTFHCFHGRIHVVEVLPLSVLQTEVK